MLTLPRNLAALLALTFFSSTHFWSQGFSHADGEEGGAHSDSQNPADEAVALTNEWYPVLTDEEVDPQIYTDYEGTRVYLCSQECHKKFRTDPTAYLGNLPAFAASLAGVSSQGELGQHAHGDEEGEGHGEHGEETEGGEQHGHDHGGREEDEAVGLISWLGRFHPMVVHFPIAFLLAAAAAELLSMLGRGERFAFVARYCLWLGAAGAVGAALLGWADAIEMADEYSGFSARLLLFHRWLGVTTACVAVLALWAGERRARSADGYGRAFYRGSLLLSAVLVSVVGHLGASLIYGWEFLS